MLILQKQLMSTKYCLIYTHFAVGGKGLKNAYFHLSSGILKFRPVFSVYCRFLLFSLLFNENERKHCFRAQVSILRSSGHSVKEIAKLLKKTERWVKWLK